MLWSLKHKVANTAGLGSPARRLGGFAPDRPVTPARSFSSLPSGRLAGTATQGESCVAPRPVG